MGDGDPKYSDPAKTSFTKTVTNQVVQVDYIAQDPEVSGAAFILDKSVVFSQPGVERLNDSIRTYVWAILGAQAQTRTHLRNRHRLQHSEAVHGKHRRCHFISSQSPISHQALPRRPTVCWLCGGLRVQNRPLHGPFGHATAHRAGSWLQQRNRCGDRRPEDGRQCWRQCGHPTTTRSGRKRHCCPTRTRQADRADREDALRWSRCLISTAR